MSDKEDEEEESKLRGWRSDQCREEFSAMTFTERAEDMKEGSR